MTTIMKMPRDQFYPKKSVIIIGGGFAGLEVAKALSNRKEVMVHLIDKKNHHLFQPLLYQVATGGLNPSDIAVPIRAQFRDAENVQVHLAELKKIDLTKNLLHLDEVEIEFDYAVIACGVEHSYFGHPEWEEFAPGLKTVEHALEIRRRILRAFESAENEQDLEKQKQYLTFIVVGGGPTGVEVAGAIADISRTVLIDDFKRINPASARIILIEAGRKLLAFFPDDLSQRAKSDLETLGVEVILQRPVTKINAEGVELDKEFIHARTVIWGAGVQGAKLDFAQEVTKDRAGRIKVENDFSIPGYKNTFVVGDLAQFEMSNGTFLPGLAPSAIQGGKYVGKIILNDISGISRKAFTYNDKGIMATIGKKKAVAMSGKIKMTGLIAWFAWFFIHVFYLVGIKNKVAVMVNWAWCYIFSKRGARLITDNEWRL